MSDSVVWTVRGGRLLGPAPFFIAGIVNVTPDSFYDGGSHPDAASALVHARALAEQGACILDIGGESTRPGAATVDLAEEIRRVLPVVAGLEKDRRTSGDAAAPAISVDTYKAGTAAAVLEAGADIINDISACAFDPGLIDVLAQHKPGYVLMHSQGRPGDMQRDPRYDDVVSEILSFFEEHMARLVKAGLPEDRVVIDPGIGFGKLLEHNLAILQGIERFASLGRPVYMGLSNKTLWSALLGVQPGARQCATQAATAILAWRGVRIHRVHEVAATFETLRVVEAMRNPC